MASANSDKGGCCSWPLPELLRGVPGPELADGPEVDVDVDVEVVVVDDDVAPELLSLDELCEIIWPF